MSSYAYSHLLPAVNLQSMGLYGTLLVTPECIRFMSLPEVLMLMGALQSCWLRDVLLFADVPTALRIQVTEFQNFSQWNVSPQA